VDAALDQIQRSINVERGAAQKTKGEVTGESPITPTVKSQEEYDKLKPGADYIGPDGRPYKKQQ
jgi:hypothetical protein